MRLPLEEQEQIRRAFHIEGRSIRQIARETGHSRLAVRRAVSDERPSPKLPVAPEFQSSPIFGPFQKRVEELAAQNDHLPRK